jgi:hypothetical protein
LQKVPQKAVTSESREALGEEIILLELKMIRIFGKSSREMPIR